MRGSRQTAVESLIRQLTPCAYLNSRGMFHRFSSGSFLFIFFPSPPNPHSLSLSFFRRTSLPFIARRDAIPRVIDSAGINVPLPDIFIALLGRYIYIRDAYIHIYIYMRIVFHFFNIRYFFTSRVVLTDINKKGQRSRSVLMVRYSRDVKLTCR